MKIIDLSADLAAGMVRFPSTYLPDVQVTPAATHEKDGRSAQIVTFGTHVSTHVDAPFHAIPEGKTIDQINLSHLFGPAKILRIAGHDKKAPLEVSDLEAQGSLDSIEKLILNTRWAKATWGTKEYFTEGPYLSRDASRFLASLPRLHLLGMDFPNIDTKEDTLVMGTPAPNHQILMRRDIVLLENLLHLEEVDDHFLLSAAPPKLKGGDGCPCRAMAAFPLSELSAWVKPVSHAL